MTDRPIRPISERRQQSRVRLDAHTELHQGGTVWNVELIDISLNGLAVTQPEDWDADYGQSFTAVITLENGQVLELYAHVVHIEDNSMGFQVEHIDPQNLEPLQQLLEQKLCEI